MIRTVESLLRRRDRYFPDTVLETLQFLGALDDDAAEHRAVVLGQVRNCLEQPNERDSQVAAWRIYAAQFDHPYADAYCGVVSDLTTGERKALLTMAAKGVPETSFGLVPLLHELASFGDCSVGENLARWTVSPPTDKRIMPEEDVRAFVVAHVALAGLGCPLPGNGRTDNSPSARALEACGAILYWSNRPDLDDAEILNACRPELDVLEQNGRNIAVDVVCECEHAYLQELRHLRRDGFLVHSIVERFPTEVAEICRDALREPGNLVEYFTAFSDHNRRRNLTFAIDVLKDNGTGADRPLLRKYASCQDYGNDAITALKAIEKRLLAQPESAT